MERTDTITSAGHFHAVRFYQDSESLARIVADFLADGIVANQPAIVIATPDHRVRIEQQLNALSLDVATLQERGDLFLLDAQQTLSQFMVDGLPDAARFRNTIVPVIERARRRWRGGFIRAYGEMVDVLWKQGHTVAAIRLETLWNQLATTCDFSLLCGYSLGNCYRHAAVDDIQDQHTHLISEAGQAVVY